MKKEKENFLVFNFKSIKAFGGKFNFLFRRSSVVALFCFFFVIFLNILNCFRSLAQLLYCSSLFYLYNLYNITFYSQSRGFFRFSIVCALFCFWVYNFVAAVS